MCGTLDAPLEIWQGSLPEFPADDSLKIPHSIYRVVLLPYKQEQIDLYCSWFVFAVERHESDCLGGHRWSLVEPESRPGLLALAFALRNMARSARAGR